MATSASTNFNLNRTQILRAAALKIHAIDGNETMSADMESDFNIALNAMVKRWNAKGIRVWTVREATLFPAVSQVKYALASGGADHATETYYATTLSAAEAASQTTLSVTSSTNMTVADNIGIVLDNGTLFWTTISSKTSTTVTVASAITSAAASGNAVFNYTTKLVRPLKIVDVRRYNIAGATDTPISLTARLDYQTLPNKAATGSINQIFYDPQLSTGYLYLWQAPSTIKDLLKFTWHKPIEDFDAAGDNPDLPQEWIDTLIFNLAVVMAPEYDVGTEKFNQVRSLAAEFLDDVSGFDREAESIFFQPDYR